MLKIILTRHGATDYTERNIIQGAHDSTLIKRGREQARTLARHLHDTHIDVAYASDLGRSIETAEIILAERGVPINQDPRIRERDWGRFTGRHKYTGVNTSGIDTAVWLFYLRNPAETGPDDPNRDILPSDEYPGETRGQVMERVSSFYSDLTERFKDATILVIGHGYANAYLLNCAYGIWPNQENRVLFFHQEHTCINEWNIIYPSNGEARVAVVDTNFRGHMTSAPER